MNLRERIHFLCKAKGVTLNKVESDLRFGKGYLSKLEKSSPNSGRLQQIADYFDVSLEYLMNGLSTFPKNDACHFDAKVLQLAEAILSNKELYLLFDVVRDADPDDIKTLYYIAQILKNKGKKK